MPAPLAVRDLENLLDYAAGSLNVTTYDHVRQHLLPGLVGLVGSDTATLTHLDLATQREVAIFWPTSRPDPKIMDRYARVGHTHPLRPHLQTMRRGGRVELPIRISDVLTSQAWRQSPIYRESHTGISDQMCLVLGFAGSSVRAITLSRTTGRFTDRQQEVLARSRAYLRHALARTPVDAEEALEIAPQVRRVLLHEAPGLRPVRPAEPAGSAASTARLSPREQQVLDLVARGMTDAQIARQLQLSPATVSKHLHRVYVRLQLPNRAAAVEYVRR
jgi:DNA-binding CsgD family transcriptional regulator